MHEVFGVVSEDVTLGLSMLLKNFRHNMQVYLMALPRS